MFALAPGLPRIPTAGSLGISPFQTLTIPLDANAAKRGDCGLGVDLRNLIACSLPGCTTVYRSGEQLSQTAKYICRNHPRQDQVEAFQKYVSERRDYDSAKDRQDARVHFQERQFDIKKTKPGDLDEFRAKRFCIALPRFDSNGMPVSAGLNAQMAFDVSLPSGWFDSYPAGDPRGLPDSNKLHLAEESEWSKQTRRTERDARAKTRGVSFKAWVNELPLDEQPSADAYRFGVARRFIPRREFVSKDSMLLYALPSLVDLPETEFLKACAERKKINRAATKLLREIGFFSLGESVYLGPMDPRDSCPRCGCQFYTRDENGELHCHDCHLYLPESEAESEAEESDLRARGKRTIDRNPSGKKIYDPNAGRWLQSLTPEEFVNGLIKLGRFRRLPLGTNLKKAAGSYQILVEGKLPRDVAQQTGEKPTTIKSRADDVFEALNNGEGLRITEDDVLALKLLQERYLSGNPSRDSYLVEGG